MYGCAVNLGLIYRQMETTVLPESMRTIFNLALDLTCFIYFLLGLNAGICTVYLTSKWTKVHYLCFLFTDVALEEEQ